MPQQWCVFCEIVAGRASVSVVYENEYVLAFLDLFSITEGHTLVVPKTHAARLDDMDADTGMQVFAVAHRLARRIGVSGIRCEGVNLLLSDGEAAGQEIFPSICTCYRGTRATSLGSRSVAAEAGRPGPTSTERPREFAAWLPSEDGSAVVPLQETDHGPQTAARDGALPQDGHRHHGFRSPRMRFDQ